MDFRSFGPYNICLVTDRSIYCHMTLSAMNYLLFACSTKANPHRQCTMVRLFSSSMVDCSFETRSSNTKDYSISIRCFFAKNAPASSKDWLAQNQDNACGRVGATYIYPRTVVSVSQHCNNPTYLVGLVQSEPYHLIEIELSHVRVYIFNRPINDELTKF